MRRVADRLARVLLGAVLLHAAFRFGTVALHFLRSPWSRDYGEGAVLAMVQVLGERGTYFTDLRDYPLVTGNYPPVYVGLVTALFSLFGPALVLPRLVSVLATLGIVALLYLLLRRLTGDRPLSLALALFFLAPWFVQTWGALARVDMLAFAFSAAGLLAFVRAGEEGRPPWRLAFPLFWLAFFTRQSELLAPAAVLAHVLLRAGRRTAVRHAAAFALPLAALFGALVAGTSGEAFRHLVLYTGDAGYEWPRMLRSAGQFAVVASPLLALVVAGALLLKRDLLRGWGGLFAAYALLNLLGLATIAKVGAAQNYFIAPWLATLVLAGVVLHALALRWPRWRAWRWPVLLAAALAASYASPGAHRLPQAIRNPAGARDMIELDRAVRESAGPVLSENMCVLVTNGKPVLLEPFGYTVAARSGRVRPDRLLRDCEGGRFEMIVTEYRLYDIPGFPECLDRRYYAWKDLGPYQVFRPRAPSP